MFNNKERIRVEDYGAVEPHQEWAFNFHLQNQLKAFDEEYDVNGGRLGSPHHQMHRQKFAGIAAKSMIDGIGKDETLYKLQSQMQYDCPSIGTMNIETQTTLGYEIDPIEQTSTPLYSLNEETLRVELFGNVRTHQSAALNFHLQQFLEGFDKEFENQGGKLGSIGHRYDRMKFAQAVSNTLFDEFENKDYDVTSLKGYIVFNCHSIPVEIKVDAQSKFGYDTRPVSEMPFYEPN